MESQIQLFSLNSYDEKKRLFSKELNRTCSITSIEFMDAISEAQQVTYLCTLMKSDLTALFNSFHHGVVIPLADYMYGAKTDEELHTVKITSLMVDFVFEQVLDIMIETDNESVLNRIVKYFSRLSVIVDKLSNPDFKMHSLNESLTLHYVGSVRPILIKFGGSFETSRWASSSIVRG